jgi:hypothetical protein
MTAYQPLCEPCRSHSQFIFRVGCPGCETRRARIAAEHKAVSDAQVRGADSMFGTLPETTK